MSDIHIHRDHALGLAQARKIAFQWAEQVEQEFDMACEYEEGHEADEVRFTRSGVKGTLAVGKNHFELHARLGLLLGAFKGTIEAEIVRRLDELLAHPPGGGKTTAARAHTTGAAAGKTATTGKATAARKTLADTSSSGHSSTGARPARNRSNSGKA